MPNRGVGPQTPAVGCVLRPNPKPILIRAAIWGFFAVGILAVVVLRNAHNALVIALFFAIAAAFEWVTLKTSSITLDENGFEYRSFGSIRAAHRWADLESFCVVTQRGLGFIRMNQWLGWRFSPEYKHHKWLAIPRAVTRAMGMADGMIKTVGYSPKELASLLNQFLERSRAKIPHNVSSEE
jgi:hypothetical protein